MKRDPNHLDYHRPEPREFPWKTVGKIGATLGKIALAIAALLVVAFLICMAIFLIALNIGGR